MGVYSSKKSIFFPNSQAGQKRKNLLMNPPKFGESLGKFPYPYPSPSIKSPFYLPSIIEYTPIRWVVGGGWCLLNGGCSQQIEIEAGVPSKCNVCTDKMVK